MADFGWNYPPGVSRLPGESRAEMAYEAAYDDDGGYHLALWRLFLKEAQNLPKSAQSVLILLGPDELHAFCVWLYGSTGLLTREEYAQGRAEEARGG